MIEISPNLVENINLQHSKKLREKKKIIPRHILIKLLTMNYKGKNFLKVAQERGTYYTQSDKERNDG